MMETTKRRYSLLKGKNSLGHKGRSLACIVIVITIYDHETAIKDFCKRSSFSCVTPNKNVGKEVFGFYAVS